MDEKHAKICIGCVNTDICKYLKEALELEEFIINSELDKGEILKLEVRCLKSEKFLTTNLWDEQKRLYPTDNRNISFCRTDRGDIDETRNKRSTVS